MATNGCLPGNNGQSCHASRPSLVSYLITLYFCIALTHATVAPEQCGPCKGSTPLLGLRAADVHLEQITEKAPNATQDTSQITLTDTLRQIMRESYMIQTTYCMLYDPGAVSNINDPMYLSTVTTCLHLTTATKMARLNPHPRHNTAALTSWRKLKLPISKATRANLTSDIMWQYFSYFST